MAQAAVTLVLTLPLDNLIQQYKTLPADAERIWARTNPTPRYNRTAADVQVCMHVDDIAIHVTGSAREVASTICRASADLIEALEDGISMRVSRREAWRTEGRGKTFLATTSQAVSRKVATSMRRLGIQGK